MYTIIEIIKKKLLQNINYVYNNWNDKKKSLQNINYVYNNWNNKKKKIMK